MQSTLALGGACLLVFASPAPPRPAPVQGAGAVRIVESFDDRALADLVRTGAAWGGGDLRAGYGGGSGRLGDLVVPAGATVVLSTDAEDFSAIADPAIFDPSLALGAASAAGGFFDFASVTIESGGVLRFEGPNPARLHARGVLDLQGTLDVSGTDAGLHDDSALYGASAPAGGPGGAAGGKGADQPDGTAFAGIPGGGTSIPGGTLDGEHGGGIPEPSALGPTGFVGGGGGGHHHPDPLPADPLDVLGVVWDSFFFCETRMLGAVGGGGGYAFAGKPGHDKLIPGGIIPPKPPLSPGGGGVAITPAVRALLPERGLLRGGSGGGGGGAHIAHTRTNGLLFGDCTMTIAGAPAAIVLFDAHSAAGGGGGGGAVEAVAGKRLVLEGRIDASGGAGGSTAALTKATSGGGGSGGAVRVLAREIQLGGQPGRLDVSGGQGGLGIAGGTGGPGSPGLVRVESVHPAPDAAAWAAALSPDAAALAAGWSATPDDVLSTATWAPELQGPAALSGAQSCWRSVAGASSLAFQDDLPGVLGWDMTLELAGIGPVSWRGANPVLPLSFEQVFGTELFGAPVVVRFQGARSQGPIADPCAVELHGPSPGIVPGSLTPWVLHPAELNLFASDPARQPDLVRFQILFDRDQPFAGSLESVLELWMLATPQ